MEKQGIMKKGSGYQLSMKPTKKCNQRGGTKPCTPQH